jgi:FkbM family methyltransferase
MSIKARIKAVAPPRLWDFLHRMRTRWNLWQGRRQVARFPSRVVRHDYAGVPLDVTIADPVAEVWYDRDWVGRTEFPELDVLRGRRLRPGARVFDVGAHQGVVALILADIVGPSGSVVAVEAHPHNARVAERNRDLNRAAHLTVVHAAIADRTGRIVINEVLNSKVDDRGSFGRIEVDAITVDDLADRHGMPDVLFIDVEGYEVHALRGARRTLESRPDVVIEVHTGCGLEEQGESVASLLAEFPPGAYNFSIAPGMKDGVACDCLDFEPYRPESDILLGRFFLHAFPATAPAVAPPQPAATPAVVEMG